MNKSAIITHKRRRMDGEGGASKSEDKKHKEDESNSSSAAASRKDTPSGTKRNHCSLIPSDKLVYGRCPNVSSRYEKLGRIGEGTYGRSMTFISWPIGSQIRQHSIDFISTSLPSSSTGVVYRARDKETKEIVALKRCLPHHEATDGFPLTTLREITLLRELQEEGQHNGLVILRDVAVSSRCVSTWYRALIWWEVWIQVIYFCNIFLVLGCHYRHTIQQVGRGSSSFLNMHSMT